MLETEVSGHNWLEHAFDAGSIRAGVQGAMGVNSVFSFHLRAAGGDMQNPGDYRYGVVHGVDGLAGGSWGILRVYPPVADGAVTPLNPPGGDNPYTPDRRPIRLLGSTTPVSAPATIAVVADPDWATLTRQATAPVTATVRDDQGGPIVGADVTFTWELATPVTLTTDANGVAQLDFPVTGVARQVTITATVDGTSPAITGTTVLQILADETTPPRVRAVSPLNGATGIDPTTSVLLTFNEQVDPRTVTPDSVRLLVGGLQGTVVPTALSLSADRLRATLVPSAPLAEATTYTVQATTAIRDLPGNPLTAFSSTFTTRDTVPPPAPTNLSGVPGPRRVDLSWLAGTPLAADLAGYYVTVDGRRVGTNLITGTKFRVSNLTGGRAYGFQVFAVDRSGNVSAGSNSITVTPRR